MPKLCSTAYPRSLRCGPMQAPTYMFCAPGRVKCNPRAVQHGVPCPLRCATVQAPAYMISAPGRVKSCSVMAKLCTAARAARRAAPLCRLVFGTQSFGGCGVLCQLVFVIIQHRAE